MSFAPTLFVAQGEVMDRYDHLAALAAQLAKAISEETMTFAVHVDAIGVVSCGEN